MTVERQVTVHEIVVARRPRRDPQVWYPVCEVIASVWRFAALEFGVEWQCTKPRLRRIAEDAHRRACVCEEKPGALVVSTEHLRDPVGPAGEKLACQPRLEC